MPKPFKERTQVYSHGSQSRIFQGNHYQNSTQSAALLDEWKLYQNDGDTSDIDTDQRVDHYWNAVFLLTSVEGNGCHQLLPIWSSHALFWPRQMLTLIAAF